MTVSLTVTVNICNEAVKRTDCLSAQPAFSVRREETYNLVLATVKDIVLKTHGERANLMWLVNDLV